MIDVKQATAAAATYMKDLLPNATDVNLEEVEISDDDRLWYITLSALVPVPAPPSRSSPQLNLAEALSELFNRETQRIYKVVKVNAENGFVRSMKMRPTQ